MNERERELIAALAEGSLQDDTEARSLLEGSAEAQAEYRLQLAALQALSELSPAELSGSERADLRRDLWARLRAEKAKARSTVGIYGWSLAAAALFVIVGLAAVLGNQAQSGGDAAEGFEEISSGLAEAADTTAASDTFAAADSGAEAAAPAEQYFAAQARRLRSGDDDLQRASDGEAGDQECLAEAGIPNHEVVAVVGEDEGVPERYLAAVPAGETIGPETPIHFVDATTCDLVYSDG